MLEPVKHFLKSKTIILASGSPRRREILEKNLGLSFKVVPSTFPENLDKSKYKPAEYVIENSRLKALDVASTIQDQDWFLIIGSDTVVEMNNNIYEKPSDKEDAFRILKALSNNTHRVLTGVTLVSNHLEKNYKIHSFHQTSEVLFDELTDEVIKGYIESGEPMDKAGGYGIQGLGSSLVKSINGDYFNIEGFPANKFSVELKKFIENIEAY